MKYLRPRVVGQKDRSSGNENGVQWTELNNETTTSLACGKERGLRRARLKNAFDSRKKHGRVLKTKTFFLLFKTYSHFERFKGQN